MKKILIIIAACIFLLILVCSIILLISAKRLDADNGTIRFPTYEGTETMDVTRDMIFDLNWVHKYEGGNGKRVTFKAVDSNGKNVVFDFTFKTTGTMVQVSAEQGSQYTVAEITTELARRIDIAPNANPLAKIRFPKHQR